VRRTKYYANNYLQKIDSGVTQTYNYDGVDTGNGEASLRMSIGRKHNRSKQPIVRVNGTQVAVPTNWAGYDQSTRIDFFGTIEIPFDASLLNASNEVTVQFPDSGGHLASMILQMEKYDSEVVDNTPPPNPPSTNEQRPFSGAPINLPGRIEAEEFDFGGQDVAYNDADASNNGASVMREDEGVDIEARDGGVNVGWTADGEWLEYTVKPAASSYDISLRYATPYANRAISVQLGDDQLGVFQLPVTGSWGNFETITLPKVAIDSSDTEILRMTFQGGSTNVNWLEFAAANSTPMCIIK